MLNIWIRHLDKNIKKIIERQTMSWGQNNSTPINSNMTSDKILKKFLKCVKQRHRLIIVRLQHINICFKTIRYADVKEPLTLSSNKHMCSGSIMKKMQMFQLRMQMPFSRNAFKYKCKCFRVNVLVTHLQMHLD